MLLCKTKCPWQRHYGTLLAAVECRFLLVEILFCALGVSPPHHFPLYEQGGAAFLNTMP